MGSGERKLTLYTNGEKVREVEIQHEKEETFEERIWRLVREDHFRYEDSMNEGGESSP